MRFSAEPWAQAFLEAFTSRRAFPSVWTEREAAMIQEALDALGVFCKTGLAVPGKLSGFSGAARIAPFIDAALAKTGGKNETAVYARTFFLLMIRKSCLYQYAKIIDRIQKLINEKKGLAEAALETPFEADEDFVESVRHMLLQKTGAREIAIERRLIPELGGGMRLRIGSVLFDGSLASRLEQLQADLSGS